MNDKFICLNCGSEGYEIGLDEDYCPGCDGGLEKEIKHLSGNLYELNISSKKNDTKY